MLKLNVSGTSVIISPRCYQRVIRLIRINKINSHTFSYLEVTRRPCLKNLKNLFRFPELREKNVTKAGVMEVHATLPRGFSFFPARGNDRFAWKYRGNPPAARSGASFFPRFRGRVG